jgi:hypothetical protein
MMGSAFATGMTVTHVALGIAAALGGEHEGMNLYWSMILMVAHYVVYVERAESWNGSLFTFNII